MSVNSIGFQAPASSPVATLEFAAPANNPVSSVAFRALAPPVVREIQFEALLPLPVHSVSFEGRANDPVSSVAFRALAPPVIREIQFEAPLPPPVHSVSFEGREQVHQVGFEAEDRPPVRSLEFRAQDVTHELVIKDRLLILLAYINAIGTFLYQGNHTSWEEIKKGIQKIGLAKREWDSVRSITLKPVIKWPEDFDREHAQAYNDFVRDMCPKQLNYGFWFFFISVRLQQLYGRDFLNRENLLPYVPVA